MLIEMRIKCEACAGEALLNGFEELLVLKAHPIEQVIEQRCCLDFIESAELVEPFIKSAPYVYMPSGCQDFDSGITEGSEKVHGVSAVGHNVPFVID
jgi:hypothetical protein